VSTSLGRGVVDERGRLQPLMMRHLESALTDMTVQEWLDVLNERTRGRRSRCRLRGMGRGLDAIRSAGPKVVSERAAVQTEAANATDRMDQLGPLDLVLIRVKLCDDVLRRHPAQR
jgi:hypothetical protein